MAYKHKYIIRDPKNKNEFIFVDDKIEREKTENTIREMNQNSNLGFDLLNAYNKNVRKNTPKEWGDGYWIDNYMSIDYHGDNIILTFSGYPHDEVSGCFLTDIEFSSNKYNVFGIKTGDNISVSRKILKSQGFEKIKNYAMKWVKNVYKKNDLYILLITDHDNKYDNKNGNKAKIERIIVRVKTFYLGNRIY
jgi:hypothetical protein